MALLDLFSGIGGFSLGLERTGGFRTVAFCEREPYCQRVLAHHWPGVPIYPDVRDLDAARLRADGIDRIDIICGGFPCQDISLAGSGAGLAGERSGLWREFARIICEIRPIHVIVENTAALLGRGHGEVVGDLAAVGYRVEWHCIPAAAVGAHQLRDRVWIIASHPDVHGERREQQRLAQHSDEQGARGHQPDGLGEGRRREGPPDAAGTPGAGLQELRGLFGRLARALAAASAPWERTAEPPLLRVAHGIPVGMDRHRVKALGNAVVPLIPELIGRALLEGVEAC